MSVIFLASLPIYIHFLFLLFAMGWSLVLILFVVTANIVCCFAMPFPIKHRKNKIRPINVQSLRMFPHRHVVTKTDRDKNRLQKVQILQPLNFEYKQQNDTSPVVKQW